VITDAHERRCGEFATQLSQEHSREFLSMPLDVTSSTTRVGAKSSLLPRWHARHGRAAWMSI
jgi:hypothetical protein